MSAQQIQRLDNGISAERFAECVQLLDCDAAQTSRLLQNLGATGIAAFCDESGRIHVDAQDVDDALAVTRVTLSEQKWTRLAPSAAPNPNGVPRAGDRPDAPSIDRAVHSREPIEPSSMREQGDSTDLADPDDLAPPRSGDSPDPMRRGRRDHPSGTGPRRWNRRLRGPSDPDAEAGDHYVPPPPPALPESNAITVMGWVGVLGAPAFVLIASLLGFDLGAVALLACLGVFLGGFAVLLLGAQDRPPTDSGWDDGAVL